MSQLSIELNKQIPELYLGIQAGAGVVMLDVDCELREGLMKGVVKNFYVFSPEKKQPDGNSEQLEQVLGVKGGDNFGRRYKVVADPAWITICNRLMRKIGQEMSGEMRKNYYASATPFYFSEDCASASKLRYLLVDYGRNRIAWI